MGRISSTNKNFVIAYVLLVGLPLLGLAGILRSGKGLTAPISVDGVWKFSADSANRPSGRCGKSLASLQDWLLTISQSGKKLVVSLNNGSIATGSGVIEGTTLNATVPLPEASATEPDCVNDGVLTLNATISPQAEARSMQGTFSVRGCPSCSSVKYEAVRQTRSARAEVH